MALSLLCALALHAAAMLILFKATGERALPAGSSFKVVQLLHGKLVQSAEFPLYPPTTFDAPNLSIKYGEQVTVGNAARLEPVGVVGQAVASGSQGEVMLKPIPSSSKSEVSCSGPEESFADSNSQRESSADQCIKG